MLKLRAAGRFAPPCRWALARTLAGCAATSRFRAGTSSWRRPGRSASSTSAWRRPTCSSGPGRRSHDRAAAGSRRRDGLHLPQSRALDRPAARRGGGPVDHRRRPALPHRRRAAAARRAAGSRRPLRLGRPLRPAACRAARRSPAGCARAGQRAVAFADDNALVDREVAYRAGLGWFGKNANLLVAGAGSWFVLGCGRHHGATTRRPRRRSPTGAARAGAASTRCPTGAIVAPGVVDASRCLAWLLQKPGTFPVELRAALGDRIYGCDDCQEVCPPTVHLGRRHTVALDHRRRGVGRRARPARRRRRDAARPPRPLVHRRARSALAAAQRAGGARQRRLGPAMPRTSSHARPLPPRRRRAARRARRAGRSGDSALPATLRPTGRRPPTSAAELRRSARREAPARHQRLPAEDRRHPVAAVGVVAAAAAGLVRRAHQPVRAAPTQFDAEQPFRIERTPRAGAAAAPAGWCGASTTSPREVGADLVVLDPALPLGLVGPSLAAAVRRRAARRRGHRARPAAGHASRRSAHVLRRARHVIAAGGYPAAEAERAAGRDAADHRRAAGRRHRALPPARRRRARGGPRRTSACPPTPSWWSAISPARAPQGLRHGHRAAAPLAPAPARPACWRSPAAAATTRRLRRLADRARRAGALPRPGAQRRPAAPVRLRRRVRHAVPQPVGRARAGGLRHRVRRGRGVRRAAGRRRTAAPPRPSSTARPGSSSPTPRTSGAVADAVRRPARRPGAAGRDGPRPRGTGPSPSSPTTCSPQRLGERSGVLDD